MKIKWSLRDTAKRTKRAWCQFFCCDSYPSWQNGRTTVLAAFNQLFVATSDVITSDSLFHIHRVTPITLHGFFLDSFPLKDQPDFLTTRKTKTKSKTKTNHTSWQWGRPKLRPRPTRLFDDDEDEQTCAVELVLPSQEALSRIYYNAQWSRCQLGCSGSQNFPGSNYRRITCSCSYYMEHAKILL